MHVFFAPDVAATLLLPEDESKHAVNVLRMKTGDRAFIADGAGTLYQALVDVAHPKRLGLRDLEKMDTPLPRRRIGIAIGITKQADRLEWFVEKATELGVRDVHLLLTERTGRHRLNTERLRKIAVAAMKQSGNVFLPSIAEPVSLKHFLHQPLGSFNIVCTATAHDAPLSSVVKQQTHLTAMIGPEGDFSDEELRLVSASDFTPVNLGPYRLRTETAAIAVASALALSS